MESMINFSFRSKTVFHSLPEVDLKTLPISKTELFMTNANGSHPLPRQNLARYASNSFWRRKIENENTYWINIIFSNVSYFLNVYSIFDIFIYILFRILFAYNNILFNIFILPFNDSINLCFHYVGVFLARSRNHSVLVSINQLYANAVIKNYSAKQVLSQCQKNCKKSLKIAKYLENILE